MLFFAYPVRGPSASEVTRFVACAQVFSFHCRTVVFHHLNVFCTSGRVFWPGVVVSPLSLPSYCELCVSLAHQDGHVPEGKYTIRKLVYFSRKPVTDRHTYIHTYKHNLRIRPHKRPPRPHDYVPHAKAFGNNALLKACKMPAHSKPWTDIVCRGGSKVLRKGGHTCIGACRAVWVPGQDLATPHLMRNCEKGILSLKKIINKK